MTFIQAMCSRLSRSPNKSESRGAEIKTRFCNAYDAQVRLIQLLVLDTTNAGVVARHDALRE